MMNENIANIGKGKYTKSRYIELITSNTSKKEKADNRTGKQIADDIIAKTGIKLVKSNGN